MFDQLVLERNLLVTKNYSRSKTNFHEFLNRSFILEVFLTDHWEANVTTTETCASMAHPTLTAITDQLKETTVASALQVSTTAWPLALVQLY